MNQLKCWNSPRSESSKVADSMPARKIKFAAFSKKKGRNKQNAKTSSLRETDLHI